MKLQTMLTNKRIELDNRYSRKEYKKAIKVFIAKLCDEEFNKGFTEAYDRVVSKYTDKLDELRNVPHSFEKPTAEELEGKEGIDKALAWLPFNNGKRIVLLETVKLKPLSNKDIKEIMRHLIEASVQAKADLISANILLPKLGMQLIQVLSEMRVIELIRGENYAWYVKIAIDGIEDLRVLDKLTRKNQLKIAEGEINTDSFLISQSSWRYDKKPLSIQGMEAIASLNHTWLSFADYVDEEVIEKAVRRKYKSNESWVDIEIKIALDEYRHIMRTGNKFRIDHFVDGCNRLYEESSYFGVQQCKEIRSLLRFHNKRRMTKEGIRELRKQIEAEPEWAKAFGWEEALEHYNRPTGVILYQDATTQGTQLFGVATGSIGLLKQGGAYEQEELVKAYELLSYSLNEALSIYYGRKVEPFTVKNVKGLHMTSLYNIGKHKLLNGGAVDEEYVEVSSKFKSLLETVRGYGLDIDSEELWNIYKRELNKVSSKAIHAMKVINNAVDDTTLIYEWTSLDGMINQYAMVKIEEKKYYWLDSTGKRHSITHHEKVLEPKAKLTGLAPRIIQSADSSLVRKVAREYSIVTIHDSYGSHPNDAVGVRESYLEGLLELFDNDFLTRTLEEITGKPMISLQAKINREEVRRGIANSKHALLY